MILELTETNTFIEEQKDIKDIIESLIANTIDKQVLEHLSDRLRYINLFRTCTFLKSAVWPKKTISRFAKIKGSELKDPFDILLVGMTTNSDAIYYYLCTSRTMFIYILINDE